MALTKNEKMKRKIVNQSKKLFAKQGYTDTSMRQIASQMGYKNQASLYYYYKHKKHIGRELFNLYFSSLNRYLFSLPEIHQEQLLFLPLREICSCHLILMNTKALKFMIEVDSDSIFTIRDEKTDLYYGPVYTLMKKKNPSVTATDIKIALSYYITGFTRILREWDYAELGIDVEAFIERIPSVLLWFLRFEDKEIADMVNKARAIFSNIPKKDLARLRFF